MNMNDEEIFQDFITSRNLKYQTINVYKSSIAIYKELNKLTLKELLTEAEKEEDNGIPWKRRKLKQRLVNLRLFLYQKYLYSTANIYLKQIQTIYRHYEIEIHPLPFISDRNVRKSKPVTYNDLPDHEIIKQSLKIAPPPMRAIILFISSSGTGRAETLNLTIQDFIDATIDYHKQDDIYEVMHLLKNRNDIVPYLEMNRQKMNKYYYTFCSPESTSETIHYLLGQKRRLKPENKLFKYNLRYLNNSFAEINNKLQLGKVGPYNRFRSHMLRKFHSSQLLNDDNNFFSDKINFLQGRSKNSTDRVYLLENPNKLKKDYIEAMHCLSIKWDYNKIDMKTPEYLEMENKVAEAENIKNEMEDIKKRIMAIEQDDYIRQYETPDSIKQKYL